MSSGVLNERLMIRYRLQEAFKKIIFISDHDFAQDQVYKKANQVLYARLKKLEDYLDIDRPRSVRDVIPNSHLTKYGMYQYDEGREMSYTSSIGCISVHYPCIYKSDVIREPWMLPEVEQVFMHTLFNSSCNFKLYEADLEQLEKIDLLESTDPGYTPQCCSDDLHQVYPNVFPLFERTPGKTFFPDEAQEEEIQLPVPLYFTSNSYGEAILKKRILSDGNCSRTLTPLYHFDQRVIIVVCMLKGRGDFSYECITYRRRVLGGADRDTYKEHRILKENFHPISRKETANENLLRSKSFILDVVRELWNTPKAETRQNVFRIYKSTLDNIFVEEDHVDRVKSVNSERSLQNLVNSILELSEGIPKLPISTAQEPITPPVRRLYSDVVQGNKSPTKNQTDIPSPTLPRNSTDDFLLAQRINSSHISLNNSPISGLSPDKCGSAPEITTKYELDEARCVPEFKLPENVHLKFPESSVKYSYSDAVNNIPGYPANQNMFLNDYPTYDGNYRNSSSTNFQNFFSPLQYVPNTVYGANYRLGSYSNTFAGTLANQQVPTNRPNVNSCQQHPWFFPTYRSPNICSYGNFLGQLLLPQVPTNKTRWNNPQYSRPPTQQNMYQPVNQNWGVQNVYRSNSNLQMPGYPSYDQKSKPKKSSSNPAAGKFTRSKTPDHGAIPKNKPTYSKKSTTLITPPSPVYPPKILSKPSSDYKLMTRYDDARPVIRTPTENDPNIPVNFSASDELEKIALREYQSSNDLFFTEIERQAQEQYDGNPENLCCPPNKHLCLGGLAAFIHAFYLQTISTPDISLLKLRRYYLHMTMFTV